jgi:C_GCAxxG_C_C family probable redox protein
MHQPHLMIPETIQMPLDPEAEALVARIKARARNLYATRQLLCTEAVLVALNHGLKGGLTEHQAISMAAPFCIAVGNSGCMCGALSGAVLASGLLLGNPRPYRRRRDTRESSRQIHDAFKAANGATCCRVLSQKVKDDKKAHFRQCTHFTADAAEMAARLILRKRPEIVARADVKYLSKRQSRIGGAFKRLCCFFSR